MNHQKQNEDTSTRPFIKLDNITICINDQLLFAHTNWLMETGQHWAIIGPNGSGKSVLANTICRKVPIHEGQISYFFNDTNQDQGAHFFNRGEIVMVSPDLHKELAQQYGGYHQARFQSFEGNEVPTVSVYLSRKSIEHISPYEITPFKTDESVYWERRRKATQLLHIENLLERKMHQLSNGETRKILLVRALIQAPKLLILDDPYGGLDTASRQHLQEVIETILGSENMQILIITSRYEEVPEGITHLLEVENNRIVYQGPKELAFQGAKPLASQSFIDDKSFAPVHFPAWKPNSKLNQSVLVEMKNVKVSYHGITVLTGIDWTVKQGEYWAVLGDNGAGKTTLLSLILADNPQAYSNEIYLFGQKRGEGESIWDIKRNIGWISPELQMYYSTNSACLDVICSGFFDSIGIYQNSSPDQQKIALDWMRFLSIPQLANIPFYKISIGQQRLVLLGRALVKSPPLLIFDEPCQGLDISYRQQIINLIDRLCQETPVSLIYVTHYSQEIPRVIDHWLILEEGRIKEKRLQ